MGKKKGIGFTGSSEGHQAIRPPAKNVRKLPRPKMVETETSIIRRAQDYVKGFSIDDPRHPAMPQFMNRARRLAEAAKLTKKVGGIIGRKIPVVGAIITAGGLASDAYAAGKRLRDKAKARAAKEKQK